MTEDNASSKNEEGVVVEDPDSLTEQEKEDVREKVIIHTHYHPSRINFIICVEFFT